LGAAAQPRAGSERRPGVVLAAPGRAVLSADKPDKPDKAEKCSSCGERYVRGEGHRCRAGAGSDRGSLGDDALIGTTIDNRYQIESRLGEGGMGVVYRARHVILNKPVAIKVLRKAHEESAWKRFVQEAQSASMINHTNVVAITDFGVISNHAYLVMEFLEGQTLTEAINEGPLPAVRMCRIGAQIARGLQEVHEKGIVHRDLKPDNIFLLEREGRRDTVKIVDFGLAKMDAGERLTMDGTVVGTAEYISPEQVTGQDTDARSDQYSLGCILYEMLTSQLPFDGESTATLIYKHVYKNPTPPRKVRPEMNIPPSVEAVVLKCMAKKPSDRFASMRELEQALVQEEQNLEPLTSGGTTMMVRPRPVAQPPWWRRLVAFGLGGLGLLAALALVLHLVPLRLSLTPVNPEDLAPYKLPDLATREVPKPADGGTAPRPDAAVVESPSPPGPVEPPDSDPPDGPSEKVKTPKSAKAQRGLVPVRFVVEPTAVNATVICKNRRTTCKGACTISIPAGSSCQFTARGYRDRVVRYRELRVDRGKRLFRVVLSPFKL
jgi:serine/threonine protein kinase